MRLTEAEALTHLTAHDRGVLGTVHPSRGVDLVPVVYAVAHDAWIGIPIDRVKPKTSGKLQRERNLETDSRATLLVDEWSPGDWSELWWVRAELCHEPEPQAGLVDDLACVLGEKYAQYSDRPFERILVLRLGVVTGWSAS